MKLWSIIKDWIKDLNMMDKIIGEIISFVVGGVLKKMFARIKPDPIKQAYKRAVKKNAINFYGKKYYMDRRLENIEGFCQWVKSNYSRYDKTIDKLYVDFKIELEKTDKGKEYLHFLQQEGIGNELQELIKIVDGKLQCYRELEEMLHEIREDLYAYNKGKRKFDENTNYLQRYCSRSISDKEYLNYLIHKKSFDKYRLVDIVLGKTEYKENKYILLSGAHTGKTTELERLGWELIEEGSKVPIMFKIGNCENLRQELPALKQEVEKGLVLMIDALDERFDGQKRLDLYREIEGYADEHPYVTIVLSLRANFAKEKEINGFCKLVLHDLTDVEADNYLASRGLRGLIETINAPQYHEFARIPFCLIAMADYYKEKNTLPESKSDLYNFFIKQRLIQEEKKGIVRKVDFVDEGMRLLQRIAVAIQLMGANTISEKDLFAIVGKQYELMDLVKRTGLIESDKEKGYYFTHNSFKEYLVSNYLLSLGDLDEIKKICCYKGMAYIKTGWYNTVALLLSQLSVDTELSKLILDWIVEDNKEMVLLIDNKLFEKKERIRIFKEIVDEYKNKDIRFADMWSSDYEALMRFGASEESAAYLLKELSEYKYLDSHMVNVLLLVRYIRQEDIPLDMAQKLNAQILTLFRENCDNDDYDYVFFEALENPWMLNEQTTREILDIIKDSKQPSLLNHFVSYVIKAKCVEVYINVILEKSHHIHDYSKGQYSRSVMRDFLYEAYKTVENWDNIKKVLKTIADNFKMIDYSIDREKEQAEKTISVLLGKTARMIDVCPDAPDYVFHILGIISEERTSVTDEIAQLFLKFFDEINETQRFYDETIDYLWGVFIDQTSHIEGREEHRKCEAMVYCAALFLNKDRLEDLCDRLTSNDYNSYNLLSWLEERATPEMKEQIDVNMNKFYHKYWRDKNALTKWQKRAQKEFDEFMNYEWFNHAVITILDEKMPQNKEDVNKLRRMKFEFSDDEEDRLNEYIIRLFYTYVNGDVLDVKSLKEAVCNYEKYQEQIFYWTYDILTSRPRKRIVISEEQKKQYVEIGQRLLRKLINSSFDMRVTLNKCAELKALLLHHYTLEKKELLKLLPYSNCYVYNGELEGIDFKDSHYTLLDYLVEKFADDKDTLILKLRECFENVGQYDAEQLQQWAEFVVNNNISSEYKRMIEWMILLPDESPAFSIAKVMLGEKDSKKMVLDGDVLKRCSVSKRLFIYEELSQVSEMNDFVVKGIETDFEYLKDYEKKRAVLILLSKGSMMALEYVVDHTEIIDFRNVFRYHTLEAFNLLINIYVKVIDKGYRVDYNGIIDGIGMIAKNSDDNWIAIHQKLSEMIKEDRVKYVHFNFYLEKWKAERLELSTPAASLEDVILLLDKS